MFQVRRAADRFRGGDEAAGIDTRHAFSFSGFYDPEHTGFGLLVACNEERLAPGAGFGLHRHRDLEIVTWVVEGELEHRDSTGRTTVVHPGDVQRLSAGGGVWHSERNAGERELRFVQMWLVPGAREDADAGTRGDSGTREDSGPGDAGAGLFGGEPEYEVVRGIADGTPYALRRSDAVLHVRRLADGGRTAVPDAAWVYAHVVRGTVECGGARLAAGDAARVADARELDVTAVGPAELLIWEMHAEPSYG